MRDETDTTTEPQNEPAAEAPATPETAEPVADQAVEGHFVPHLTADDVASLKFARDFINGVPYAVEAVTAAEAG